MNAKRLCPIPWSTPDCASRRRRSALRLLGSGRTHSGRAPEQPASRRFEHVFECGISGRR